jgi:exodeoxyribonuclease-3
LKDAGYSSVYNGEALPNGVAILCKGVQPAVTRRALPGHEGDPQARYLEAAVHGVLIAALYPMWYAACCLAGEAGLRVGEIRALD